MFALMIVIGVLGAILCGIWFYAEKNHRIFSVPIFLLCVTLASASFAIPQGQMIWKQMVSQMKGGNWIVVDNSGGLTLRHWILTDSYVGSSDQSDGWKFYDSTGICYVGGDAFVKRIGIPIEEFLKNYKELYNIPAEQKALN